MKIKCPKCRVEMDILHFGKVEVDRCPKCQGLWFDELELHDLKAAEGAESLDRGNPRIGKIQNTRDQVHCSRCHGKGRMLRMVDPHQSHIQFECCKVCGGVFLDAGEFKDLKEETLMEKIRALLNLPPPKE